MVPNLGGHCPLDELLKVAKEHGVKPEEYKLVVTDELKKEYCSKCRNISC